jgi:hypothetical protein
MARSADCAEPRIGYAMVPSSDGWLVDFSLLKRLRMRPAVAGPEFGASPLPALTGPEWDAAWRRPTARLLPFDQ